MKYLCHSIEWDTEDATTDERARIAKLPTTVIIEGAENILNGDEADDNIHDILCDKLADEYHCCLYAIIVDDISDQGIPEFAQDAVTVVDHP